VGNVGCNVLKITIQIDSLDEIDWLIEHAIHRDDSMRGTSLMIEVHEDCVVIKNPGGLLPGVSVNALTQSLAASVPYNLIS
jgi:hypothetical protein